MNKKEQISKLIDEALASVESLSRAEAKPFLLTRIQARMTKETESVWEKAGWFITRPAVAFSGLCMIILINLAVIVFKGTTDTAGSTEQVAQSSTDEFSYTVATIYDTENTQP
ncbi:MAG: hypothetical protein IPP96_01840 [Chitinophagaceae bacterium]|nr:hypothetical protein [Chitinophagaceae bacterium]